MTTKLHHQNKQSQHNTLQTLNKQQIKDTLCAELYDPVIKQFKTRLQGLAGLNSFLARHSNSSFTFRGKLYNHDHDRPLLVEPRELISSLHHLMDCYLEDLDEINHRELPLVLDYINRLLNHSNDFQHHPNGITDEWPGPNKHRSSSNTYTGYSSQLEHLNFIANQDLKALGFINQRRARNLLLESAGNDARMLAS
jgi:hypothetical protein